MRKWAATRLLGLNRAIYKLACLIYPPRVTETGWGSLGERKRSAFADGMDEALCLEGMDGSVWSITGMPPDRRESRGWN